MITFLKWQHRAFCIRYVEQFDHETFNRAKLLNIGADLQTKMYPGANTTLTNCLIFHDVDTLPTSLKNFYTCYKHQALHLCDKLDTHHSRTLFGMGGGLVTTGGVVSLSEYQWRGVNGLTNRFYGWGPEDAELAIRLFDYKEWDVKEYNRFKFKK